MLWFCCPPSSSTAVLYGDSAFGALMENKTQVWVYILSLYHTEYTSSFNTLRILLRETLSAVFLDDYWKNFLKMEAVGEMLQNKGDPQGGTQFMAKKRSRHLSDHLPSGRLIPSSHEQLSPPKAYLASHPGLLCLSSPHYQCLHLNNHPHLSHLKVIVSSPTKMWSPHNLRRSQLHPVTVSSSSFNSWLGYVFRTWNPMIPLTWTLLSHLISLLSLPSPLTNFTNYSLCCSQASIFQKVFLLGGKMNSVKRTTSLMFSFSIHNVSYTWGIFRHLV